MQEGIVQAMGPEPERDEAYPSQPSRDDAALIEAARTGSERAIRGLIETHWDRCYRAAYLITRDEQRAEDVAQEALLAAIGALETFDTGRPLGPWLNRIVVNRALDLLRAENARPQALGQLEDSHLASPPAGQALDAPVAAAIGALSLDDRAALVMRYVLGYRAAEIGELLDMAEATVRTRLHRAMEKLRETLEVQHED